MPRHWAAVRSGFFASISPSTPVTYGLAMLVPDMEIHGSSGPPNPLAARMSVPGAAISGLDRPSRVGPWLLVMLILSRPASRFATAITFWPQARLVIEWESTLDFSLKNDGNRK